MPGHIVALGGGGFSMESDNTLLDDFILGLARRKNPRVCFIPTASADSPSYVAKFYRAFSGRCLPSDLVLFDSPMLPRRPATSDELEAFVMEQDVFYVGGGNTVHLLAIWRAHGLDVLLRKAWEAGAVLSGISAGMLCWFEGGLTDSFGDLRPFDNGLGFASGTASPHYDGEPGRQAAFRRIIADGAPAGYAADDFAAVHFVGNAFHEAVSSRAGARVHRVERINGVVTEVPVPVRYLGRPA